MLRPLVRIKVNSSRSAPRHLEGTFVFPRRTVAENYHLQIERQISYLGVERVHDFMITRT